MFFLAYVDTSRRPFIPASLCIHNLIPFLASWFASFPASLIWTLSTCFFKLLGIQDVSAALISHCHYPFFNVQICVIVLFLYSYVGICQYKLLLIQSLMHYQVYAVTQVVFLFFFILSFSPYPFF